MELARNIVSSKIANSRNVLRKYNYNHPDEDIPNVIRKLGKVLDLVRESTQSFRLRGLEGVAARLYFSLFDRMLRCDLKFEKRSMYPPKNEVNSLMSLTYVMVMNELLSITEALSFDPHVGFFHTLGYGKPSLALDLLEPFRSCLCDQFVFRLLNLRILDRDDFCGSTDAYAYQLSDEGLKKYLMQYEERMSSEFTHPVNGKKTTWRDCLRMEAEAMRHTLLRGEPFSAFSTSPSTQE